MTPTRGNTSIAAHWYTNLGVLERYLSTFPLCGVVIKLVMRILFGLNFSWNRCVISRPSPSSASWIVHMYSDLALSVSVWDPFSGSRSLQVTKCYVHVPNSDLTWLFLKSNKYVTNKRKFELKLNVFEMESRFRLINQNNIMMSKMMNRSRKKIPAVQQLFVLCRLSPYWYILHHIVFNTF